MQTGMSHPSPWAAWNACSEEPQPDPSWVRVLLLWAGGAQGHVVCMHACMHADALHPQTHRHHISGNDFALHIQRSASVAPYPPHHIRGTTHIDTARQGHRPQPPPATTTHKHTTHTRTRPHSTGLPAQPPSHLTAAPTWLPWCCPQPPQPQSRRFGWPPLVWRWWWREGTGTGAGPGEGGGAAHCCRAARVVKGGRLPAGQQA